MASTGGPTAPQSASSSTSQLQPSHPGAAGVQHRKRDFYSESKPIPSIQRFFRRGLVDAIGTLREDEDSETDEEGEQRPGGETGVLGTNRLGRKIAEHEQSKGDDQPAQAQGEDDAQQQKAQEAQSQMGEQPSQQQQQRRTHKPRMVDDPITRKPVYIHDVGKREYARAMREADEAGRASRQGESSGPAAAMVQSPIGGAMPFGRQSTDDGDLATQSSPLSTSPKTGRTSSEKRRSLFSGGSLRRRGTHQRKSSRGSSIFGRDTLEEEEEEESEDDERDKTDSRRESSQTNGNAVPDGRALYGARRKEGPANVLTMPFPPLDPLPKHVHQIHPYLLPAFGVWALATLINLVPRIVSVIAVGWMAWWAHRTLLAGAEDRRWERERQRGRHTPRGQAAAAEKQHEGRTGSFDELTASQEGVKEGAEWLNSIMEGLWAVMNPDLFSSLGATLEDVMQASIPKFIHAVKVEDLAQGSTPLRLTGFRVLPDAEAEEIRSASQQHMREERKREQSKFRKMEELDGEQDDKAKAEDAGGTFINLEMSFVYRARPTTDNVASKSRNAHLLIKFWVGAKKLVTVPLPVWVEIKGMVGSVRARVQLTPDPPFIKNVTFTFMGLPRVGVEVIPLHINTSNIPLLSGFIQGSIDAAVGEYCAPSSMTMDLGEMLMGDNIKREVDALGVAVIYIHSATDLEKQDVQGSSDPYCTIQLAKYGKVQYATRVALNDLSPRWEERYVMLIHPEAVRAREKISVGLWDSDRFSADDMLGRAEVDLWELVKRPGRMFRRTDTLVGLTQEMEKQGLLHWSVGFFAKTPNQRRLTDDNARKREEEEAAKVDKQDPEAVDVREVEVGKDYHVSSDDGKDDRDQVKAELDELHLEQFDSRVTSQQTRNIEHAVAFEPPSPALPSGILSMQVHQISQLEVTDTRASRGTKRRTAQPGQEVEQVETQEDKPNAPSAYVTVILNDETIFRTRTKALSTNPFYNAGTERFVRDWRRTLVMFVVYDNRLREADAILGVVPIKLTDIFQSTSQVTTVFPLAGGVGRGHLRISMLFRPIQDLSRHKEKLGWDIGTMRILSSLSAGDFTGGQSDASTLSSAAIRARTLAGQARISSRRAKYTDRREKKEVEWCLSKEDFPIKVPVRRRYAAPFILEFRAPSALGLHKTVAMCIVWMQDVSDDDMEEYKLPIWRPSEGSDFHRLLQNYHNFHNEAEAEELGVERMGYLHVKLQFKSGVGKVHTRFDANPDAKVVMDAWRACTSVGLRSVTGDFTDMRWNTRGMPVDELRESQDLGSEKGKPGHKRQRSSASMPGSDANSSTNGELEGDEEQRERRVPIPGEASDSEDDDTIGDEDDEDGEEPNETTVMDKIRKWSEERKELHRQHRGLKQYKGVRTATWIGRGIRDRSSRAMSNLKLQERRAGQVETEI